jgi:uncharacterized protein
MNDFAAGIAELRMMAEAKLIAGIKLYPGYQDFHPGKMAMFPLYELAAEFKLPVMLHGGELHACCRRKDRLAGKRHCEICWIEKLQHLSRPEVMANAFAYFPEVDFVVSHLANPYFDELRSVMNTYQNVFTDLSGQFVSGRSDDDTPEYRQLIVEELKKFIALPNGIDRLLFATDFPIQSYEDSISIVKALGLTAEEEEKIFYANAYRLLNK